MDINVNGSNPATIIYVEISLVMLIRMVVKKIKTQNRHQSNRNQYNINQYNNKNCNQNENRSNINRSNDFHKN